MSTISFCSFKDLTEEETGLFTITFPIQLDKFKNDEPDFPGKCKVVEVVTEAEEPMLIRIPAEHYWKVRSCIHAWTLNPIRVSEFLYVPSLCPNDLELLYGSPLPGPKGNFPWFAVFEGGVFGA